MGIRSKIEARPDVIPMLRTVDLCKQFRVTPMTINRWIKTGRLPAPTRIGRNNYWASDTTPLDDLQLKKPTIETIQCGSNLLR